MPQNDRPASGLRRRNSVQSLQKPVFEPTVLGRAADFAEHDRILADLASTAVEPESMPDDGLLVSLSADTLARPATLTLGPDGEDLLDDARADIAGGHYEIALALLEEFLERRSSHQEARFLRAYCLARLKEPRYEEALRILRPLRDEDKPEDLAAQVGELRAELRRRLAPAEYKAYADAAERAPRAALDRVADFLELVPEDGKLSCLLVLGHARLGDLDTALDAAERGIAEADTDQQRLKELARRLLLIRLRAVVEPATRAFKARDPRTALALLGVIDVRWRSTAPVKDFERYLALVIEHANPAVPPAPLLPGDRAEDLYSLIAEADVNRALDLMDRGGLELTERMLASLMSVVPGFRWLNFVYAICLYRRGRHADLAERCARTATQDPTIAQAPDLLEAVHIWQEAIVINPVVDAFIAITDALADRAAPQRLPALRDQLVALEHRIPDLRAATRTAEGRKLVDDLGAAIGNWRAELDKAQVVNMFYDEYERVMSAAEGRLKTVGDVDRLAAALDALGARISAARPRLDTGKSGKDPLDELARRVQARRAEAAGVKTTIEVSELVRRFNELMAPILSGTPNVHVYQRVGTAAKPLGQQALRLRNAAGGALDDQDRKLLDQLISTIGRLWP